MVFERSFSYTFDTDYKLIEGTETEGLTTRTYGANWEIVKEEFATGDLPKIGDNYAGIPAALITVEQATKILVKKFDGGGSQTSYFDTSGKLLGYSDTL